MGVVMKVKVLPILACLVIAFAALAVAVPPPPPGASPGSGGETPGTIPPPNRRVVAGELESGGTDGTVTVRGHTPKPKPIRE